MISHFDKLHMEDEALNSDVNEAGSGTVNAVETDTETREVQDVQEEVVVKFKTPSTPGWEILVNSAQPVLSDSATVTEVAKFMINLVARMDEYIPKKHFMDVITIVAAAATKLSPKIWPCEPTSFLTAQLGEDGIVKFIQGSGYEIYKCPCGNCPDFQIVQSEIVPVLRQGEEIIDDMLDMFSSALDAVIKRGGKRMVHDFTMMS